MTRFWPAPMFNQLAFPFSPIPHGGGAAGLVNPLAFAWHHHNTQMDRLAYGTDGLAAADAHELLRQKSVAGSIWVVSPKAAQRAPVMHEDYASLRAAVGRPLARFAIAGIGGTALGAVAFAQLLADHYGEPVGAIVAGYGPQDLLSDALGGLAAINAANLGMHLEHLFKREAEAVGQSQSGGAVVLAPRADARAHAKQRAASGVLVDLLQDPERKIQSVAGHSKGGLAISFALDALFLSGDVATLQRALRVDFLTVGMLIQLPQEFRHVTQCIGAMDAFGTMNSNLAVPHHLVPDAGHHLNADLPMALDLAGFLATFQV